METATLPTTGPTDTVVWFPPTSTYTPLPTITQSNDLSQEFSLDYGDLIFSDDFSDPELWGMEQVPDGRTTLALNQLTLAVTQPKGYLFSLRQGAELSDFFIEITASPNICRGFDEYGLLFRVSPNMDFFRFALTCNGQARVDRFIEGLASSPIPPTLNSAIPRGAPSSSRLRVIANGKDMVFYANGVYLFTMRDPSLDSGAIGVFVRASGEDLVTVNFSDLAVYEINQ